MNILLATMGMDIGGAETHILELAKCLKKRGNNVFVVSNGGKYAEELNKFGIVHIWAPLNNKKLSNMIKSYKILSRVVTENNIEIIHSHSRISSFICGIVHKNTKIPFVTSAHWTFKVTPLLKAMTNWGEYTIAVSNDIKDYLINNYGVDESKIIVTVNGIDTDKFSSQVNYEDISKEFSLQAGSRRIVYVSRLDESRAMVARQLINISEQLNNEIENLEIVIVGGGDVYDELSELARRVNDKVGKKLIIMTGPRTDINKFISSGEIFIGVSRAVLEAMAEEKPVIIAGNEGYIGIFDETKLNVGLETNFCCRGLEMSTEEMLKSDIVTLINEANKEKYGKYNRETVKNYYSVDKMTDDCLKAYSEVRNNVQQTW